MKTIKRRVLTVIACMLVVVALFALVACNDDPGETTKTLDHITLNKDNVTKEFNVGDELDCTGLVVTAHYDDKTSATVTTYTATANNLDEGKLTLNSDTVTVSYTEEGVTKTAKYGITVTEKAVVPDKKVESIAINQQPTTTKYYVGETFDKAGLKIDVTYDDDSTETVTTGFTTSNVSTDTAGEVTVTVTFGGKNATFTINVYNKLTSIVVEGTDAYNIGDTFQGVTVTAYYNNATTNGVTLSSDKYTPAVSPALEDNKFATAGAYTVTVNYSEELIAGRKLEVSDTLNITVTDPDAIVFGNEDGSMGQWNYWTATNEKNWDVHPEEAYCTVTASEVKFINKENGVNIHAVFTATGNLGYGFQLFYNDTENYNIGSSYILTLTVTSTTDCAVTINGIYYNLKANEPTAIKVKFTYSYEYNNYNGVSLFDMQVVVVDGVSYDLTLTNIEWAEPDPDLNWELTQASLVEEDGKVYFVYSGTYENYTEEDLKNELSTLKFDIVYPVDSWPHAKNQDGFTTIFAMDNGEWTYKTEITVGHLNGYYTTGVYYIDTASGEPYSSIWTVGEGIETETHKYTFAEPYSGWGVITFRISEKVTVDPDNPDTILWGEEGESVGEWKHWTDKGIITVNEVKFINKEDGVNIHMSFSSTGNLGYGFQLFYNDTETYHIGTGYTLTLTITSLKDCTVTINGQPYNLQANNPTEVEVKFTYTYNGNYDGMSLFDMQVVVVEGESYDLTLTNIEWVETNQGGGEGPGEDDGQEKPINHAANQGEAEGNRDAWNYFLLDDAVTVNKCVVVGSNFGANSKIIVDYSYSGNNWTAFNLLHMMNAGIPNGYQVTFTFKSSVSGYLTVNGNGEEVFKIEAGENTIVKTFAGAMLWLRFGSDGRLGTTNAPLVGSFEIIGIEFREITKTQLEKPSFNYDAASGVITINDEANAGKVKEYKLNFYLDGMLKGSITVVSGAVVEPVGIAPGTYTVKLVAVGDNVRYTDSEESDDTAQITIETLNTKKNIPQLNNDGEVNDHKDEWSIWAMYVELTEATYDSDLNKLVISYQWTNPADTPWFGIRLYFRQSAPPKAYIKCTINVESEGVYMINGKEHTLNAGDNEIYVACNGTDFMIAFGQESANKGRDSQTVTISNIEFTNDAPPAE